VRSNTNLLRADQGNLFYEHSVPDGQKAYSMTDPLRTSAGLHRRLNLLKSGPFGFLVYDNVFYPIS
jgi:hypothetical protein